MSEEQKTITMKVRALRKGQRPQTFYSAREKKEVTRGVWVDPGTEFDMDVPLIEKDGKEVPKLPRWVAVVDKAAHADVVQSEPSDLEKRLQQQEQNHKAKSDPVDTDKPNGDASGKDYVKPTGQKQDRRNK